jgi:PEGA domain
MLTACFRRGLLLLCLVLFASSLFADNKVLGEIELEGASKVERDSGVWVDGQYLGYLKELHGSKKILLLPGTHDLAVRQDGYVDFRTTVTVQPATKQLVMVKMEKDLRFQMPHSWAEIKLSVNPDRAAVFVAGLLVGHAGEFGGVAHSLLVAPGHRKISIRLPGYQEFNTEVDLAPNQKFDLKTNLLKEPASTSPAPQ